MIGPSTSGFPRGEDPDIILAERFMGEFESGQINAEGVVRAYESKPILKRINHFIWNSSSRIEYSTARKYLKRE